jgi:hypothetical protein
MVAAITSADPFYWSRVEALLRRAALAAYDATFFIFCL